MYPQFLTRQVVKDLEGYLTGIRNGKGPQERAKLFATAGNKGHKELIWNCPMGHFTDSQRDLVADTLNHHQVDYATAEELFNYDVYQLIVLLNTFFLCGGLDSGCVCPFR
ncbi:Hypothetical predicted protein [Paramuricea clavata]|uniref:Uncharacterized protein n=1 Tax=Paramuricea clavata TaxID=317549 RepID=A0A7D9JQD4_PARCT|nr:Hypothetical predicted protein [Paramuricea clavata]